MKWKYISSFKTRIYPKDFQMHQQSLDHSYCKRKTSQQNWRILIRACEDGLGAKGLGVEVPKRAKRSYMKKICRISEARVTLPGYNRHDPILSPIHSTGLPEDQLCLLDSVASWPTDPSCSSCVSNNRLSPRNEFCLLGMASLFRSKQLLFHKQHTKYILVNW
jgi:hypothetical protein